MKTFGFVAVLAIAAVAASAAVAAPSVKTMESSKGQVLAGAKDMTLYTFDKDSKGESSCYDTCAKNWPPFKAMKGRRLPAHIRWSSARMAASNGQRMECRSITG